MRKTSIAFGGLFDSLFLMPPTPPKTQSETQDLLNFGLGLDLDFTAVHNFPKVAAVTTPPKPHVRFMGYHRARYVNRRDIHMVCPHFYEDDRRFEVVWRQARRHLELLRRYDSVIGPDFSIRTNFPKPIKIARSYMVKFLTAWWQHEGLTVYPNVAWADKASYDYCFDGYPAGSVIAINSTGIGRDRRSKVCWMDGYNEALARLRPLHIIRYGAKQDGEDESISTYLKNDNYNATHGQ